MPSKLLKILCDFFYVIFLFFCSPIGRLQSAASTDVFFHLFVAFFQNFGLECLFLLSKFVITICGSTAQLNFLCSSFERKCFSSFIICCKSSCIFLHFFLDRIHKVRLFLPARMASQSCSSVEYMPGQQPCPKCGLINSFLH